MNENLIGRLELYVAMEHADFQLKLLNELLLIDKKLPQKDKLFASQKAGMLFNKILAIRLLNELSDEQQNSLYVESKNNSLTDTEFIKNFLEARYKDPNKIAKRCYDEVLNKFSKIIKMRKWIILEFRLLTTIIGSAIATLIFHLLFKYDILPFDITPRWFINILKSIGIE
ncbi:MAG: hypothetical protein WC209_01780 [Ignavibacteriaceae bacterium]|jgi:hypothetical protein